MDAPLASDNDNPAAPRIGTALRRCFRLEVRDTEILPRLTALNPQTAERIRLTSYGCMRRRVGTTRTPRTNPRLPEDLVGEPQHGSFKRDEQS